MVHEIQVVDAKRVGYNKTILATMPNLSKYVEFLRDQCKISMPYYKQKDGALCIKGNL